MGLGDEIMALGRAEREFERTGERVKILEAHGTTRDHIIWHNNPAWDKNGKKSITDASGARPYVNFNAGDARFNLDYRPRAGRIYVPDEYRQDKPQTPYAVINPHLKSGASPNKSYGFDRWAEVIENFPIQVFQLMQDPSERILPRAVAMPTPNLYDAVAMIENAAVVMCNEGGMHHMAASVRTPAVVYFGSFIPPSVTGYDFHYNIAVETQHGYCGKWSHCKQCEKSKQSVAPALVREKAILLMESFNAD